MHVRRGVEEEEEEKEEDLFVCGHGRARCLESLNRSGGLLFRHVLALTSQGARACRQHIIKSPLYSK